VYRGVQVQWLASLAGVYSD